MGWSHVASGLNQYGTVCTCTEDPGSSHSVLVRIQSVTGRYQHITSPMSGVVWSCGVRVSISPCIQV